jgi:hypothetical protein
MELEVSMHRNIRYVASFTLFAAMSWLTFSTSTSAATPCESKLKEADDALSLAIDQLAKQKRSAAMAMAWGAEKRYMDAYYEQCLGLSSEANYALKKKDVAHQTFMAAASLK